MSINKKILVAEDDVAIRMPLADRLKSEGFQVIEAGNGEEALILALESKPDLILLDILMPKMDGMMMLKKLREDAWGKSVPVIILSVLEKAASVAEALEGEAYVYLVKSSQTLDDVMKKIEEVLGQSR